MTPWIIGAVAVLLLLLVGGAFWFLGNPSGTATTEVIQGQAVTPAGGSDLSQQTPSGGPTNTPTPGGPQLAIPVVEIVSSEVEPIMLGAVPSSR